MFRRGLAWYQRWTTARPYSSHAIIGGGLFVVGDLMSQHFELQKSFPEETFATRNDRIDIQRTLRLSAFGVAFGPAMHLWYAKLERLTAHLAPKSARFLVTKIAYDQLIMSPFFYLAFWGTTGLMEGESMAHIKNQITRDGIPTYIADCMFWPPIQLLNFRFVPVPHQPVIVLGFSVFWDAFLSFMKHRDHTNDDNKENDADKK